MGFVPNDQLPTLLAQHNVYISLVESDGVSASLLEAMEVGLLPIVSDHLANRFWITPGINGLPLNNISPIAVASAISKAFCDLPLRQTAWEYNSKLVRERADLYHNSEIYTERFRKLVRDYHNGSGNVFLPTIHGARGQ